MFAQTSRVAAMQARSIVSRNQVGQYQTSKTKIRKTIKMKWQRNPRQLRAQLRQTRKPRASQEPRESSAINIFNPKSARTFNLGMMALSMLGNIVMIINMIVAYHLGKEILEEGHLVYCPMSIIFLVLGWFATYYQFEAGLLWFIFVWIGHLLIALLALYISPLMMIDDLVVLILAIVQVLPLFGEEFP